MHPKYHQLLDPGYLQYALDVEKNSAGTSVDIENQRRLYLESCLAHEADATGRCDFYNHTFTGRGGNRVKIRLYRSPSQESCDRLSVYLHGGGWVLGNLDSHHQICIDLCLASRSHVLAVDYRLAPENPFPAALHDCIDAVLQVMTNPDDYTVPATSLVLCGDSAGANLAAAGCLSGSFAKLPVKGLVMIYPGLGASSDSASFIENEFAPLLPRQALEDYFKMYLAGDLQAVSPLTSPLLAEDFSAIPPCYISAARHDPLYDDAVAFQGRLREARISCELSVEETLGHAYLRVRHSSAAAKKAFVNCCGAVRQMHEQTFRAR